MDKYQKLNAARDYMAQHGLDAYIIPSSDPHQSEYVADHWASRAWITQFDGSAGTAVITADQAGLWTDSRYFLQAEMQLEEGPFTLQRLRDQTAPEHLDWLIKTLKKGQTVGFDGNLISVQLYRRIKDYLIEHNMKVEHDIDLIDEIWSNRPSLPTHQIFEHKIDKAVTSRADKLTTVRAHLKSQGADYLLVSALDNLAWVLNIRGQDVTSNPVVIAYAVIGMTDVQLFIDPKKIDAGLTSQLGKDHVTIQPYDELRTYMSQIDVSKAIWIDPSTTSIKIYNSIQTDYIIESANIITQLKAIKSPGEIAHIRYSMIKDGRALTRAFKWMEDTIKSRSITEVELAERLALERSKEDDYYHESFDAIVGYKGNGAIIHYHARPETCADIHNDGMLLVDSGGQYSDGTTDITRTFSFTVPKEDERMAYTMVLKGMVGLSMAIFPEGTKGIQLDVLARQHLWAKGLNYGHGTGHGVGYFLNVHEPPQGIAPGLGLRGVTGMEVGMLTSNEPGYYKQGAYGIRIENLVVCQPSKNGDGFLEFETVTLYPFDLGLVDKTLLSESERMWINAYHDEVYEKLAPGLTADEAQWLQSKCAHI